MTASTRTAKPDSGAYNIFASYSHEDGSLVSQILSLYDVTKESVFFDRRSIKPGRKWQAAINQALRACQKVLVFWCAHSATSDHRVVNPDARSSSPNASPTRRTPPTFCVALSMETMRPGLAGGSQP